MEIRIQKVDYDNGTAVLFVFHGVKTGFQVPNAILPEDMAAILDQVAQAMRDGKSILFVTREYYQDCQKRKEKAGKKEG